MLIYSDENLEVIHRPGASPYLLVTFNEMEIQANGSRYWGQRFCEKADIAALGFISRRPNWFPAASVVRAVEAAAPILKAAPERILYGHSQGGYAALRYRRRFNATTAIAFCPQVSINPRAVPYDNRFLRHFSPELHANMGIAPDHAAGRAFIFYDPFHAVDRRHAERIANLQAETHLTPVQMTGHGTVRVFTGTERALSLIDACRANDLVALRALARTARADAPMRPYQNAVAAMVRHPAWADRLHDRFGDRFAPMEKVNFLYHRANRHIGDGNLGAARDMLMNALALLPGDPALKHRLRDLDARIAREEKPATAS
ncbi:lysophospholipase [Ensifer adhaerens]|uniref:alpha/beta hydrolase n=1 Tax=Ensifer adhaerens TaxID=106592 RepID=UPI001CBFCE21|nr:alpha/beta hydrolase [Ensifer adhaerens]MBZ7922146.1 lysophospholipase [Ensifer adhaerens]UAX94528.1 lysophospholipase [Ensifer adhaerens]UAY02163.1 lysophospholipase [Ensifer adhaerens]UAY09546.1 lysophospholipase [Ensifer adhaerens]